MDIIAVRFALFSSVTRNTNIAWRSLQRIVNCVSRSSATRKTSKLKSKRRFV